MRTLAILSGAAEFLRLGSRQPRAGHRGRSYQVPAQPIPQFHLAFFAVLLAAFPVECAAWQPPPQDSSKLSEFMRRKLDLSKQVLEGIVLEDFKKIFDGAESLRRLSQAAEWRAVLSDDYREYSARFQRVAGELVRMADTKNLDGATIKYVELTMGCVDCHKYVRSTRPDAVRKPGDTTPPAQPDHDKDVELFQFLVDNRESIRRHVTELPNGVETVTEAEDPAIRDKLREHVDSMYHRIKEKNPIRLRDPLFVEVFRNADKISMKLERTDKGVRARETSDDPYTVQLIKAHAEVVSGFLKYGRAELRKNHPAPPRKE